MGDDSNSVFRPRRASDDEFFRRLKLVQSTIKERELDGVIAFSAYMEREGNVLYLTGHRIVFPPWASDTVRNGAGLASAWVPAEGLLTLFSSYRTDHRAIAASVGEVVETRDLSGSIINLWHREFGTNGPRVVGIAGSDVVTLMIYKKLVEVFPETRWEIVDELLVSMRMIKSPYEQEVLRRAAAVADKGLEAAMEIAKPGVTEKEVASAVYAACLNEGADHVVRTRLRTGEEVLSQGRWPLATERRIQKGDLVYIDLLGWVDNYAFDVARTWPIGKVSNELKEIVDQSVLLLERMTKILHPGITGNEVVQEVQNIYNTTKWSKYHHVEGHGIGIECVENPWIMPGANIALEVGMVLSLEPALIVPDISKGQQENMVLITERGPEILTRAGYQN